MSTYPRPVEVLHDGRWLPAQLLHAYRRADGAWVGVVQYFDRESVMGCYGPVASVADQLNLRAAQLAHGLFRPWPRLLIPGIAYPVRGGHVGRGMS